jgi:hypothetical protein
MDVVDNQPAIIGRFLERMMLCVSYDTGWNNPELSYTEEVAGRSPRRALPAGRRPERGSSPVPPTLFAPRYGGFLLFRPTD